MTKTNNKGNIFSAITDLMQLIYSVGFFLFIHFLCIPFCLLFFDKLKNNNFLNLLYPRFITIKLMFL